MQQVIEEKEAVAKELELSQLRFADLSVQNEQLKHQMAELQMHGEQQRRDVKIRCEREMRVTEDDHQTMLSKMHATHEHLQQQLSDAEHENSILLTRLKAAEEVAESTARDMSHMEANLSSELEDLKVCCDRLNMHRWNAAYSIFPLCLQLIAEPDPKDTIET